MWGRLQDAQHNRSRGVHVNDARVLGRRCLHPRCSTALPPHCLAELLVLAVCSWAEYTQRNKEPIPPRSMGGGRGRSGCSRASPDVDQDAFAHRLRQHLWRRAAVHLVNQALEHCSACAAGLETVAGTGRWKVHASARTGGHARCHRRPLSDAAPGTSRARWLDTLVRRGLH